MASFCSSNHRLSLRKRRLKPLILRDYLVDDLSSSSSNGFKSFPRSQRSSTVRFRLEEEIKRSGIFHHNLRLTCGLALIQAVQKASTSLLNAVKLLPFPSSPKSSSPSGKRDCKKRIFCRNFWKQPSSRRILNGEIGPQVDDGEIEIQRGTTFADFLQESQDLSSDPISYNSPTESLVEEAIPLDAAGESSSFSTELFTNSEVTHSSKGNDVVEKSSLVMKSGDCVGSHVSDGSSVEKCVNEEKEQFSPISILQCPFEDDALTPTHQRETGEITRKSKRFESLGRLEPIDLEKRIEEYYDTNMVENKEDQSEMRAKRLFALVKSRVIEEPNHLDNVLLDFFKQDGNIETRDEDKLVNVVVDWVMRKQGDDNMLSWDVRDKTEIYVKEMKWACINGEEKEYLIEELGNGFLTSLITELVLDLSSWN